VRRSHLNRPSARSGVCPRNRFPPRLSHWVNAGRLLEIINPLLDSLLRDFSGSTNLLVACLDLRTAYRVEDPYFDRGAMQVDPVFRR
jgi:hypothetical protein